MSEVMIESGGYLTAFHPNLEIAVLTGPLSIAMNARTYTTKPTQTAVISRFWAYWPFILSFGGVQKVIVIGGPENRLRIVP